MRLVRYLLPLAILVCLAGVGYVYSAKKAAQARSNPPRPKELPSGVISQGNEFTWSQNVGDRLNVELRAANMQQIGERTELADVELKIFHEDGKAYDRVRSARADFAPSEGILYSEGDVEITMGIPEGGEKPSGRILTIRSSGVRFEAKTGKATTDKPASFTFDRGEGKAVGADYDPTTRELKLHSEVHLKWNAATPGQKSMEVTSGQLIYKEAESKVYLFPWASLKRDALTLNAADSVVTLKDGVIELVEAQKASGTDKFPNRAIEYAADYLQMVFHPDGEIQSITGEQNAKLVSASASARTTVTTRRVDMEFEASNEGSLLRKAVANGNSVVEAKPVDVPGRPVPETRILRSDVIHVNMRPGGEEIHNIETHSPGELEFVPNRPGQRHRFLYGDRMWINYGGQNRIEMFRAVSVRTRTEPLAVKNRPLPPVMTTSSKDLQATFDGNGQMTKLEQWNDFQYEEGSRHAKSDRATLESMQDVITLQGAARVWDETGSTDANRIVLRQQTDEFEAIGEVTSTRKPDRKKGDAKTGMLSGDEPVQAKAARMTSSGGNRLIRYEGDALLWQGPNRIRAERIIINRQEDKLIADGKVRSNFLEQSARKQTVFTSITADQMIYSDKDRVAHYKGKANLRRGELNVDANEIRAFLHEDEKQGTSLDKALADGKVKIVQSGGGRIRTGTSEHAEYYVGEERVLLNGGQPQFVDSVKGSTRGRQLTYWASNDRLLVDGAEKDPAVSRIRRN